MISSRFNPGSEIPPPSPLPGVPPTAQKQENIVVGQHAPVENGTIGSGHEPLPIANSQNPSSLQPSNGSCSTVWNGVKYALASVARIVLRLTLGLVLTVALGSSQKVRDYFKDGNAKKFLEFTFGETKASQMIENKNFLWRLAKEVFVLGAAGGLTFLTVATVGAAAGPAIIATLGASSAVLGGATLTIGETQ